MACPRVLVFSASALTVDVKHLYVNQSLMLAVNSETAYLPGVYSSILSLIGLLATTAYSLMLDRLSSVLAGYYLLIIVRLPKSKR